MERDFSVDDSIQFSAPDQSLGVANRDLAIIEAIHPDGRMTALLDNTRQSHLQLVLLSRRLLSSLRSGNNAAGRLFCRFPIWGIQSRYALSTLFVAQLTWS